MARNDDQKMKILVEGTPILRPSGTASPEFMIKMDDLLSSTITGFDDYAELLWFHSVESRPTAGHAAGELKGTSAVEHSLLEATIITDSWAPNLRQKLRSGDNISEIIIKQLANIGEGSENTEVQTLTFKDCKIDSIEESPKRMNLSIRIKARADEAVGVEQSNDQGGNTSSDWDYSTASSGG